MTEKILIVEDDTSILRGLQLNLEMEGYKILTAEDGQSGIETFEEHRPDLVILDIMLPRMNGYEVLESVRKLDPDVGVVILSAREGYDDKVLGLTLGADDFLAKPFELRELLARINARLRRKRIKNSSVKQLTFADVVIDHESRRVLKANQEVEMTSREYDLLYYLATRPDRVVTRTQILDEVWGKDYEGTDRTVDNFIVRLRTKLEEENQKTSLFQTVRGVGYRFSPP